MKTHSYLEAYGMYALLDLATDCPVTALRWIDRIRDLHWCMPRVVWDALDQIQAWCVELLAS